jgi:hypothetical protein
VNEHEINVFRWQDDDCRAYVELDLKDLVRATFVIGTRAIEIEDRDRIARLASLASEIVLWLEGSGA